MFLLDSYFFAVGSTMLPLSGISVQASPISGNVINIIFQLPEYVFFDGLFDSPSTVRGQSIWVQASWTPLCIPLAGTLVYLEALVDAAVFISGHRTSMYQGIPLETSLYYAYFNIYDMLLSKKNLPTCLAPFALLVLLSFTHTFYR